MASTRMSRLEREAFLAGVHVGVFTVSDGEHGPIAVPVWYGYEPGGDVLIVTGAASEKAKLARAAGRMTLCAQDEAPPYGYVSVEGPVTFAAVDFDAHIIVIAHRYLPPQAAQQYLAPMTKAESESGNVLIRLKPERWRTVDYRKAYGG